VKGEQEEEEQAWHHWGCSHTLVLLGQAESRQRQAGSRRTLEACVGGEVHRLEQESEVKMQELKLF